MSRAIRLMYGFLALLVVFACVPALSPAATQPAPVFDPNSINTVIALTSGAASTQTAQMLPPTFTPTVTLIPITIIVPTETPTVTFVFLLPTLTQTPLPIQTSASGEAYACQILSQNPIDNTVMAKGQAFEMHWLVANIGTEVWDPNTVDYRYVSGDKIHLVAAYDFALPVATGESIDLLVKMKAPSYSGTFSTRWRLNAGKTQFCNMRLTIIVNK